MIGWTESVPKKSKPKGLESQYHVHYGGSGLDRKKRQVFKDQAEIDLVIKRIDNIQLIERKAFNNEKDIAFNKEYLYDIMASIYLSKRRQDLTDNIPVYMKLKNRDTYISCLRNYKKYKFTWNLYRIRNVIADGTFTNHEEERLKEAMSIINEVLDSRNYNEQTKEVIKNCKISKW